MVSCRNKGGRCGGGVWSASLKIERTRRRSGFAHKAEDLEKEKTAQRHSPDACFLRRDSPHRSVVRNDFVFMDEEQLRVC